MHDIAMDSSGMNTVINQEEEERNKRIHLKFTAEKYLASFNNVQIRWFSYCLLKWQKSATK